MYKDPTLFWKNFRLGTELHVSGSMIYNALYSFDQIEFFHYEHEIFEFLYSLSIGIERLEKIAVILIEHNENIDQTDFEKTLITHNHLELLKRIKKKHNLSLGKQHVKLLHLISNFYRTTRYSRYNLESVYTKNQDLETFVKFLKEEFQVKEQGIFVPMVENTQKVKNFIGKLIGKISSEIFSIIKSETNRLNIDTHDILVFSKSYKIFMQQDFTFENERHLQKELLVLLISGQLSDGLLQHIKTIEPLPFESQTSNEYIRYLLDIKNNSDIIDEMHSILEDVPMKKDRLEAVRIIGSENIFFEEDDEDFDI